MSGPIVYADVEQRSAEWFALKCGRIGSSEAADLSATIKSGGEAAARRNLRVRKVVETLTRKWAAGDYQSAAMRDGIEREPIARRLYEAATGRLVEAVGYMAHPTLAAGYSPDGLVDGGAGILEIKCPIPATHLDYLQTGTIPGDYLKQCTHALWISGAQWCDFVSYQPDFTGPLEALQLLIIRMNRDEAAIAEYELRARAFLRELDLAVSAVQTLADIAGRLRACVGAA